MIQIRRSHERGHADHGWLDTRHSFSFARYYDPAHMGFRSLRVLNDDRVAPGKGFPMHGHRDMEILTYVLDGALRHRDSAGHESEIGPGTVQKMSAGSGIRHSEANASDSAPLHLLQIWIEPHTLDVPPSYAEAAVPVREQPGRLHRVASPVGANGGGLALHQDAHVFAALLEADHRVEHPLATGRGAWVHIARGHATVNGVDLGPGDAAAIEDEPTVTITANGEAEVLLFDLA